MLFIIKLAVFWDFRKRKNLGGLSGHAQQSTMRVKENYFLLRQTELSSDATVKDSLQSLLGIIQLQFRELC